MSGSCGNTRHARKRRYQEKRKTNQKCDGRKIESKTESVVQLTPTHSSESNVEAQLDTEPGQMAQVTVSTLVENKVQKEQKDPTSNQWPERK